MLCNPNEPLSTPRAHYPHIWLNQKRKSDVWQDNLIPPETPAETQTRQPPQMMDAHVLCNFSSADCPILVQTVALPNVIALCCHFHINECKTAPLMSVRAHYIYWCALVSSDRPSASFKQTNHSQLKKISYSATPMETLVFDHLKSRRRSCRSLQRWQSVHFHCLLFTQHHTSSSFIRRRWEFTKAKKKELFRMAATAF